MTYILPDDVTAAQSEHGLVLLDQRNGRYWQLNKTGAATLSLLLDGYSPAAAAARLTRDFPDASERAQSDVTALVETLEKAGLLEKA